MYLLFGGSIMRNSTTREDILERIATDLLSIPSLLFREIRRKLVRMTLADTDMHITPLNYEVMSLLEEGGTLHIAEIGEKLHIARAQMTPLIDKLVALKMVERETGIADRRTTDITLTDQGRAFLEVRRNRLVGIVMEIMSSLTDEELEDLANTLKKLRDLLLRFQEAATQTDWGEESTNMNE